jgi:hypothetical protein
MITGTNGPDAVIGSPGDPGRSAGGTGGWGWLEAVPVDAGIGTPAGGGNISLGAATITVNDGQATVLATGGSSSIGAYPGAPSLIHFDSATITLTAGKEGFLIFSTRGGSITGGANPAAGEGLITFDGPLSISIEDGHTGGGLFQAEGGYYNGASANGATGAGIIDSTGSLAVVSTGTAIQPGTMDIIAKGGEFVSGTAGTAAAGGAGTVSFAGISLTTTGASGGSLSVQAIGSDAGADNAPGANLAGGAAAVNSTNDPSHAIGNEDITLAVGDGSPGTLSVFAAGGKGVNSGDGGSSTVNAQNIRIDTGIGSGSASVSAGITSGFLRGGEAAGSGKAGGAAINAGGGISVTAWNGNATVRAVGGENTAPVAGGDGGSAAIDAAGIVIATGFGTGGSAAGFASVSAVAGDGAVGGAASITSSDDVRVTTASGVGAGGASLLVQAGNSLVASSATPAADRSGGAATLAAGDLTVEGISGLSGSSVAVRAGDAADIAGNAASGGKALADVGDITVRTASTASPATTAFFGIRAGHAPADRGAGGDAQVEAGSVTVYAGAAEAGLNILGGSGGAAGGDGVVNAAGALTITGDDGDAWLDVYGGDASGGAGGAASLAAAGITVSSTKGASSAGGGPGSLAVSGGSGRTGGDASLTSSAGVSVTADSGSGAGTSAIIVVGGSSTAPDSASAARGGNAAFDVDGDLSVAGTSGALLPSERGREALVSVSGGRPADFAGSTVAGGDALLDVSGRISVTSGAVRSGIRVTGGGFSEDAPAVSGGSGGRADVKAGAVEISSGARAASFHVGGGYANRGLGAGASMEAGDVTVTANGAGKATLEVRASDHGSGTSAGASVTLFKAIDVRVEARGAADAEVFLRGGGTPAAASAPGGTVTAELNSLYVKGADGFTGSAFFDAEGGNWARDTRGLTTLRVARGITVAGGTGASAPDGGEAFVAFEDVAAKEIAVTAGAGGAAAPSTRGRAGLAAWQRLEAETITLTRPSGASSQLVLYTGNLDITGSHETNMTLNGTEFGTKGADWRGLLPGTQGGTSLRGVFIERVSLANGDPAWGNGLWIDNLNGEIAIGDIVVQEGHRASLGIGNSQKARIGSLTAENSPRFTVSVPDEFGRLYPSDGVVVDVQGDVNLAGSVLYVENAENLVGTVNPVIIRAGGDLAGPAGFDYEAESGDGSLEHLFGFQANPDGTVTASYFGTRVSRHVKAVAEGSAAATAFVNAGSDLAAGDGIASAVSAAADAGPSFFSAVSYGSSRYDTGSHVDVKGLSLLLGGAYGFDVSAGRFTLGAFLELGDGSYDSYDDAGWWGGWPAGGRWGEQHGSGDLRYLGGGVLTRYDFSGNYVDFTARVGRASVEYSSDAWGWNADWLGVSRDYDATYYGLHLGYGHVFDLADTVSLDLNLKWLFTRQDGGDVLTPQGGRISLDDVDSHRLRLGGRLSVEATDVIKPFFGLYYEHELDGKADARVAGYSLQDAPELKGGTGIGELGLAVTATEGLTVDVGVKGYAGNRRGLSGNVNLAYNF